MRTAFRTAGVSTLVALFAVAAALCLWPRHSRHQQARPATDGSRRTSDRLRGSRDFAPAFAGSSQPAASIEPIPGRAAVTVRGHVQDSGGRAIAAAAIIARAHGRSVEAHADGDGAYALMLPKDEYLLLATAEGHAPASQRVDAMIDQTVDFRLGAAARLSGRVLMRDGQAAVGGATVVMTSATRRLLDSRQGETDLAGGFTIGQLPPGEYRLAARKGAFAGRLLEKIEVSRGGSVGGVTILLDRGRTIAGHVRATSGAPVSSATVVLHAPGRPQALSDAHGAFRLDGVLPGGYRLTAHAAGRAPAALERLLVRDRDRSEIDLILAAGAEIRGRVVGASGEAIAGAAISLSGVQAQSARTSGDGSFELHDVAAGVAHLAADHPEKGQGVLAPLAVREGERYEVTLTLADGGSIAGAIHWDDGTPAEAVIVRGATSGGAARKTITSSDGSYELAPLPTDTVIVSASRRGARFVPGASVKTVSLRAGEHASGVDLTLTRAGHQISGVVLDPDGNPVAGAALAAVREFSGRSLSIRTVPADERVYSSDDGTFTIEDVVAGESAVVAAHSGFAEAKTPHVRADATDVRVQFALEAVLSGTVVTSDEKPVADFRIVAFSAANGEGVKKTVHDPSGAFALRRLPAGSYDLVARTSDGQVAELAAVALGEGEHRTDLRLTLTGGRSLHGRVVTCGTGTPVANAMINALAAGGLLLHGKTDSGGEFRIAGLPSGGNVTVSSALIGLIPDLRRMSTSDGKDVVEIGTVKLLEGDLSSAPPGDVGLVAENIDGRAQVARVVTGSAAAGAGIQTGDQVLTVDGRDVGDLGPGAIAFLLSGAVGTRVQLGLVSSGAGAARTVTLTRTVRRL